MRASVSAIGSNVCFGPSSRPWQHEQLFGLLDFNAAKTEQNSFMTPEQIAATNAALRNRSALDIVRWAVAQANGRAMVSTNFRPYEAVVLHLCVQVQPDIPVLWVDHGYNRPATYRHAEQLRNLLRLNLKAYL